MTNDPDYRVLSRRRAGLIVAALLGIAAAVFWTALRYAEDFAARLGTLQRTNPEAALASVVLQLKLLALVQILPLIAFSIFMAWYCRRAYASESMPPAGAWIVEGQRIRLGADAIRTARLLLGLTAAMASLGAVEIGYVYYLALSLQRGVV
jgi:hypothetical protein